MKKLRMLMVSILLIWAISCSTIPEKIEPTYLPIPTVPEKPKIEFKLTDEMYWLDEEDFKELLQYISDTDFYIKEMQVTLKFYYPKKE